MRNFFLILLVPFVLFGCGSSSSGSTVLRVDFGGEWLVTFNVIVDECGLVVLRRLSVEIQRTESKRRRKTS